MSDSQASLPHPPPTPPLNPTKFSNRVAIITGAASGIGRETAIFFARQDAQVIFFDVNESGLLETHHLITTSGGKAAFRQCDITKEEEVNASIAWVMRDFGKVDILINLAGIYEFQPLTSCPTELFTRHMEINVHGAFYLTRAVLPHMQNNKYGRIVHTSSTTYSDPKPGLSAYVTSKAAVLGLVRSAAVEAGPGVTVNAVMPGLIETERMKSVDMFHAIQGIVLGNQAVKRQGTPMDVANVIGFVAGEEAGFMSGQVFNVSGGEVFSW
ncbi:SDR family NAD(P)-dependent oxidoreductase [Aspergillus stella-maris]|uniref:SDR family NAD(P)-dependent oxidoreductase n=1 Tax=Aspergillus stella-maris TaxID=1810926 RepID=UPI003CCCDD18